MATVRHNQRTLISAFLDGNTRYSWQDRAASISVDGNTMLSYGGHYRLAERISPDVIRVNTRKVSVTTSKHRGMLTREMAARGFRETDESAIDRNGHKHTVWTRG